MVVLVRGQRLWVANVGDSRALVAGRREGGVIVARGLTKDQVRRVANIERGEEIYLSGDSTAPLRIVRVRVRARLHVSVETGVRKCYVTCIPNIGYLCVVGYLSDIRIPCTVASVRLSGVISVPDLS